MHPRPISVRFVIVCFCVTVVCPPISADHIGADQICPLTIRLFDDASPGKTLANRVVGSVAGHLPGVSRLQNAIAAANTDRSDRDFFTKFLDQLDITINTRAGDSQKIPRKGPLLIVSNHPFGLIDGASLMSVVNQVRPDVKLFTFNIFEADGLKDHVIPVKLLGSKKERRAANEKALKEAEDWLNKGGVVVIFPAGRVASYQNGTTNVAEYDWRPGAAKLALAARPTVIEAYIPGTNSWIFHAARSVHTLAGTALLPSEAVKLEGRNIKVYLGDPIPPSALPVEETAITQFLREQNRLLQIQCERPGDP